MTELMKRFEKETGGDAEFIVHSVNYLLKKIDYWHLPWFVL